MARRGHDDAEEPRATTAATTGEQDAVALNDEEAIRAKLRESGWEKKKRKESDDAPVAASARKNSDHDANGDRKAKEHDRERERDSRRRGSVSARDSGRRDRRSRSRRRDDRRDRERDSRRRRDRSAKRSKPSSRRRSPSSSKSRSRSPSRSRRASSSHKRRGASPSRSVSKGRDSGSKKSRGHTSKSRSPSRETSRKKKNKDDADTDPDADEAGKDKDKSGGDGKDITASEAMEIDEEGNKKPVEPEEDGEKKKERASSASSRKGRKSSRHSPSKSRSPSRSSRRRRHRSRSRSPSHRSRRRRSSRSRSRSRPRRSDRRRRRSSRSKSHSRSNSRRYRRSNSKDKKRRDANSSPDPHEHPAGVAAAAPPVSAPVVNVNPTITQLMQQYPTMSLQEIIAKMQASNVTMAAAVSMKPARELYVGNLPPNVTGPQLQEFLGTIIQQVGLCAQPGNPILNTWISTDGHFAFCEMRSVEECNLALLLNQLSLLGQPLKFGRPRSFMGPPQPIPVVSSRTQTALVNLGCTPNPVWFASPGLGATTGLGAAPTALPIPTTPAASMPAPYVASSYVAPPAPAPIPTAFLSSLPADENSKRLLMTNIPVVLVEDQVKELVEPFGELKSFTLLTDKVTGASTGNALFEYQDESIAEEALQGLNGLDIGGIPLSIRRAPHDANGLLPADESSVVVKLVRRSLPLYLHYLRSCVC